MPYEVILVDDGSTDAVAIDALIGNYPLVNVYRQEHSGVSAARNLGTQVATGRYVLYLDSDDALPPSMIECGDEVINKTHASVIIGYVKEIPDGSITSNVAEDSGGLTTFYNVKASELILYHLRGYSGIKMMLESGARLKIGPVARLVRRTLALENPFPEGVSISEDTIWNISILRCVSDAVIVEKVWYLYYRSQQSASAGYHPDAYQQALVTLKELDRVVSTCPEMVTNEAILARVLGEVSRVARVYYSWPQCRLNYLKCTRSINNLLDLQYNQGIARLKYAIEGKPVLVMKYILCRTGLIIAYWRLRRRLKR